ncbi:tetratricopeptide repeat protein [Streptomyces sp. NPDC056708]|uniref:tetratricopeptide repeat protein n=1 Tax=unclassified Streptomyces TaxID=2593676 RepID=UPI0036C2CD12
MTPSTSKFIDDAQALMLKGHFSEALDGLLTALGVYPDSPDLHRTAAELIYLGMRNGQQEQLTPDRIADNRLDSVFCSCEASECSNSWISAGQFMTETTVTVAKPRGGRCRGCSGYFCRKHYRTRIFSWRCPRCGDRLDGAPRVANGRRPMQTVRLNQPLVHIMVIHEGEQFGPDDIERLLRAVVSDAFEQDGQAEPTVFALPVPRWPDNGEDLALASIAQDYPEYLTDGYAIYIQDGRDQQGVRWLMAKVFAKNPKIVDRDAASRAPRANTNASRSAAEDALHRPVHHSGPDHPDTLTARNNLAHWRGEAGDAAGAVVAFEGVLADRLRVLGPDHPDTLATRNNLAQFRHYRLQVERRSEGWANPVHRQTGALVDGCHGVVDASEGELAAIAAQIMERAGGSWHNCRVVFVAGHRRQDEVLSDDEVFGIVAQGDRVLVPGPAHPGFAPATQPPFGPQPRPLGNKPWKDHGLVNRQVVECGSCRGDITVRLAGQDAVLISTPENMRGTAHICGGCGRLLCVDCLVPAVDLAFGSILPKCDRCGENVGPLQAADGQATIFGSPVTNSRTYADHTATEVIDRIVECRRADRHQDRTVQYILDELRREYGHPAYPFAASLERLAYGTAGPALYQESMEPEEAEIVDAVLQRLAGNALRDEPNQ